MRGSVCVALIGLHLCFGASVGNADVVINEIMYHPVGLSAANGQEYLELHNTGVTTVSLQGWSISGVTFVFGAGSSIAPDGYFVIASNAGEFLATYGLTADGVFTGALNNGGELLQLRNAAGLVVDEVEYRDDGFWPVLPDGEGPSLELVDPLEDNNTHCNWRASVDASGHSAGAANSVQAVGMPPCFLDVQHTVSPQPNDPIDVIATIQDATDVALQYIVDFESSAGSPTVSQGDTWSYFKGTGPPSSPIGDWTEVSFDDSSWLTGPSGFGFGDGDDATFLDDMYNNYLSVYIRHEFQVTDPNLIVEMILSVDYDDAFVAYLNGVEVGRSSNITGSPPGYDTPADSGHEASGGDTAPNPPDVLNINAHIGLLVAGTNVLAVQGHNWSLTNADFSLIPELTTEIGNAMYDDGAHGDGAAGDGVYGTTIPGQLANKLVRYRIDASGPTGTMGYPRSDDTVNYDGTVVADPALSTGLPVFQWFMRPEDYQAALDHRWTDEMEPAVFAINGVVFDNVLCRIRGGASRGWAKANWKFDFPQGHHFYDPTLFSRPVDTIWLMSNWSDKSYVRQVLCYETFRDAGSPYSAAFPVQLQRNGAFYGVYTYIEAQDDDYVWRNGLSNTAARYKTYQNNSSDCRYFTAAQLPSYYEKKQRVYEGYTDLDNFLWGLNFLTGQARTDFLYDNADIPSTINYLAIQCIIHHTDRSWHNYILYRDSDGTQRWTKHAYDMDLTLGRNCCPVLNDDVYGDRDILGAATPSHPLLNDQAHPDPVGNGWNRFTHAMHESPEIREMYFRRLRTLMDEFLEVGYYENRVAELEALLASEVPQDVSTWGQYGSAQSLNAAINIFKNSYLAPRRTHLFVTHRTAGEIPTAQSAVTPIIINEIMYQPSGSADDEFLELYNPSLTESVDLSGWRIDGLALTVPPGTVILPNDYLVVVRNDLSFRTTYGGGSFVPAEYTGALNNEGETISLLDDDGNLVDVVGFGNVAPWPSSAAGGGRSIELIDPNQDNNRSSNWAASVSIGGTPDAPNGALGTTGALPALYVSEVLPVNVATNIDEANEAEPWIEIYNAGIATVDLSGMTLTDDYLVPAKWTIPNGTSLCGKQWLLVWADNEPIEGPLHASFTLSALGGSVGLYTSDSILVDFINYPALPADVAHGRFPDDGVLHRDFSVPTAMASNFAESTLVFLNEFNAVEPTRFLENNGTDVFWGQVPGNGGDWFELVVSSDHVDMRGWQLVVSDDTGGIGEAIYMLTLTSDPVWSDVRSGTVITIAEELANDVSYDPGSDDWWINVQAADSADGSYVTAADFEVSNNNWQLTILDAQGLTVFGPAGEGVNPGSGIGGDEVFKLEEDASASITPLSNYNDGSSSTFGLANIWSAGTTTQDFASLRGVVSCNLDSDCADGNVCTDDICNGGFCEHTPNMASCDDGNDCTTSDACSGSACVGTVDPSCCNIDCECDDGDPCTSDQCIGHVCQHTPLGNGSPCDDGDGCTVGEVCMGGACTGTAVDCSHIDNACRVGVCNSASGLCEANAVNEGGGCNDGRDCTASDQCIQGVCAGAETCTAGMACNVATGLCETPPGGAPPFPVVMGDQWRYFKGTQQPPADWAGSFFGDAGWFLGASGIGYGDSDDATVLGDMQSNYLTVYARRLVSLADPTSVSGLTLTIDFDDAFVAYLNGYEVARRNISDYPANFDSPGTSAHEASAGDDNPNPPEVIDLGAFVPLLRAGTNSVAIEGHNHFLTDDDFSLIPTWEVSVSSVPPTVEAVGARYLAITPPPGLLSVALRVDSPDVTCLPKYVDVTGLLVDSPVFLSSDDWGTVLLGDGPIVPETLYEVRADIRGAAEPENLSAPVFATTWIWGDTNNIENVNLFDIVCVLDGFSEVFTQCTLYGDDLNGEVPNRMVDVFDIVAVLDGFQDLLYPRAACPQAGRLATTEPDPVAQLRLVPLADVVRPGTPIAVDVLVRGVSDLRGYELALDVEVTASGHDHRLASWRREPMSIDTGREDYVFRGVTSYRALSASTGRLANATGHETTAAHDWAYLGTFRFAVSEHSHGGSQLSVRLSENSVLIDSQNLPIGLAPVQAAQVKVAYKGTRGSRSR